MNTSKNIFLVCLLTFGVYTSTLGQLTIKGKVLNQETKTPISYANIGIINTTNGTISNSDGSFTLKISETNLTKNVLFSAIGFETQSIEIATLTNGEENIILLEEKITTLDEVLITNLSQAKKYKDKWFGNPKRHLLIQGTMLADSASAGGAMALLIDKKKDFNHIQKASLFITRNNRPEFKVRLRFLNVDKANNDMPGEDLFNESIVIQSSIQRGWIDFDLTEYSYRIPQDSFFLMFEWIIEDKDRIDMYMRLKKYEEQNPDNIVKDSISIDGESIETKEFSYNASIPIIAFGTTKTKSDLRKHKCYSRDNSFAQWKRSANIISAKILMSTTPLENSNLSKEGEIPSMSKEETLKTKIEKWSDAFRDNYNIPGMQLSVSLKNNTIFSKGFGYADIENDKKVTSQTRFRIASVTKPITAAAVIKLVSEKKLDLDADIRKYVPSFPKKRYSFSTRQLAGHLAGIRDYYEISIDEIIKNPHFDNATEAINVFKDDSLVAKPGTQFVYSSFGYNLIGAAIEGASGKTYLEYMQEHIWNPLLMLDTYGDIADSTMVNKSKFYYPNEEEAEPYDLSYAHASGGLISTTDDLLRFGNEMLYGDFFKYSFKKKLFKTQYTYDKKPTNYGLGWYLGKDTNQKEIWYHVGQGPSSGAVLIIYPDDDIVISLLANTPILVNSDDGLPIEIQKLAELIYLN